MSETDPPVSTEDDTSGQEQIRTFLIADMRGWTLFTQERGDEAAAKLAAKFADIAREIVEARGGTLLELRGDEALCVFASTRQAIRAAIDLQQRFVEETLEQPELPLTVGIGLDAGEAVPVQDGYRGAALNLAARLCGQARAGEILATREVTHLARRVDGAMYEDRGSLTLKGISDPVVVVRVVPEGADPVERLRPFAAKPPPPKRASRRLTIGVGIAVVVALVAISVPLLSSGDDAADIDLDTNSIARLDADGNVFPTPLGERPGASVVDFGSLWVVQPDRDQVARVDLEDGSIVQTIRVGTSPAGIAVGDDSVWVTNSEAGTVSRINVETNEETDVLQAGTGPTGIAFADGAIWVADTLGAELLRIDPVTREVQTVAVAGQPTGVTSTEDGVWVSVAPSAISRVDPADNSVTLTQPVGNGPTSVLSAFDSIWVANRLDGTVTRLDPTTGGIQDTIPVGEGPNALAAMGDSVWVANEFADSISEIDVTGNRVRGTVPLGASPASLAADGGSLWLAVGPSASAHRGGTLSIVSTLEAPSSLDPAGAAVDYLDGRILSLTNDGLLALRKVPGADGSTLVPDLAASLPAVSADGLTYRFVLREDLRYSTGEPILPEDFRHALERHHLVSTLGPSEFQYTSLEGGEACVAEPSTCDLSRAIVVDGRTITFHLTSPDPDLPFKLAQPSAYPVPSSVPAEDQGFDAVPATGPYMVAPGASSDAIRLVRNPEFQEWSALAQPDGFVDEISWVFEQDAASSFDAVMAGDSDLLTGDARPEDLRSVELEHPDRIVRSPLPYGFYLVFEVRVPPFNDPRVRQAVSFALDRARVVGFRGGPNLVRATCQILPPNIQGFEPYCPYTIGPESDVWSAPDLDRARALIEEARVADQELAVWAVADPAFNDPGNVDMMRHVTRVLEDLGLRPNLEIVDADEYYAGTGYPSGTSPVGPHLFYTGYGPTTPAAASGYIDDAFRCGFAASAPVMCTDELEAEIAAAQALQATDPAAAYDAWTRIEHGLVDDAVWAPLTNAIETSVVSERTGNVQVHPQLGILLSRIWVH